MFPHLHQLQTLLVAQDAQPESAGGGFDLFFFGMMAVVMIVVWWLPASRERKKHQTMLEALKRGDEVLTSAGLIGTIADMNEQIVTLEIAKNVKVRVLKSTVARRADELIKAKAEDKPAETTQKTSKS